MKLEALSKSKVFQRSVQRVRALDCLYRLKWLIDSSALAFSSRALYVMSGLTRQRSGVHCFFVIIFNLRIYILSMLLRSKKTNCD